jgi:hypothetical protein
LQKERRYDRWQRNETINLVRAYLICLDELTVLHGIFSKKLDFFKRLRKDCDLSPELQDRDVPGNPPHNDEGETPSDRIAFAEHMMEESSAQCKRLGADLRESLNTVRFSPSLSYVGGMMSLLTAQIAALSTAVD